MLESPRATLATTPFAFHSASRIVPAVGPIYGFAPNIIGDSNSNSAASGLHGVTIASGGSNVYRNVVSGTADYATIGGSAGNTATNLDATVGGGAGNTASGNGNTISGGFLNSSSGPGTLIVWGAASWGCGRILYCRYVTGATCERFYQLSSPPP